jgi:hypothetical protein
MINRCTMKYPRNYKIIGLVLRFRQALVPLYTNYPEYKELIKEIQDTK